MATGIFGGSFNPPHLAHLIIAETVREQFNLERVLWVPAAAPPHKEPKQLVRPEHRVAMTRLAIEGNPGFALSDVEMKREGPSYTYDTVAALQGEAPDTRLALIIGGDSLRDFHRWHRPQDILERVPLLVYRRPGDDLSAVAPEVAAHAEIAQAPLLDISGTAIRARRRGGRSIRYLVPEPVARYIDEQGLYS